MFTCTKALIMFNLSHKMKRCQYMPHEIINMYRTHMDYPCYANAIRYCIKNIFGITLPAPQNIVPTLAGKITHQNPQRNPTSATVNILRISDTT